jgi:cytochrome b subunit of formate dehydrogenase
MAFHMKLRKERPAFRTFDYTQKAEYWAVVWGTFVMAFTGFVLWFPTVATEYFPAWMVRVSEVVHFYEAILAVAAIIIWHFFYVLLMPNEYPMSTVWFNGRYPASEWMEFHRGEYEQLGASTIRYPGRDEQEAGDAAVGSGDGVKEDNDRDGTDETGKG